MDMKNLIFKFLEKKGRVATADLVNKTGLSRAYAQRFLKELADEGVILLIGKANRAHYVLTPEKGILLPPRVRKVLLNKGLSEDKVLDAVKRESSVFQGIAGNVSSIVNYAFTEMLNNAIEHSASDKIDLVVLKTPTHIRFTVTDRGVGIFNNIMNQKKLASAMDAIHDLLKGKETTAPQAHSGEGIFFTSKIADQLTIASFEKKIVFDNVGRDVYIRDIKSARGTRVDFALSLASENTLSDLFHQYTDESFQFSKTGVRVKLYHQGVEYVSRSQARRIVAGLEKFKMIELDFEGVETVGQAFADEIFRVWQSAHIEIKVIIKNANENILFMIRRAQHSLTTG